ncbi:uncharacterized protein LOC113510348 [Galleria mellonella]|uniref:Uncharacterized protein LOC113510348 n=1 Tax=Galleria mellonella TaxID=7137 RepID=A0ABM3MB28_GALME|nr:uncharacterized protein LOC113510348 [Galleria mellonella]
MSPVYIVCGLFFFLITKSCSTSIYVEIPKNDTLKELHVKYLNEICSRQNVICKKNDTYICAMKKVNEVSKYKDFKNSCYLFMSNICENAGNEYFIVRSGTCKEYLNSRRNVIQKGHNTLTANNTNTKAYTRAGNQTAKPTTIYEIDTAYDHHICPLTCPDTYSPICLSVNRGFGKYFKFFTFMNHCYGDVYYCKNWEDFSPPPDEDAEMVNSSPLGWSYCGSSRYLQFARFSEVASSMGHYGWLAGDQRYSHIMEPQERMPGYG